MAKVLGIVAEYNPFHNGHKYQIEEAKRQTGAEFVIAIISGNFTQRGDTALVNKWTRTQMALLNGVDIVLELPLIYSISSAENFADGAIKILSSLKIVDTLVFGTETTDDAALNNIANVLYAEPKEYKFLFDREIGKGNSFPVAREQALMKYLNDEKRYTGILNGPNNILAIEYLKALKRQRSDIAPLLIPRKKTGYYDEKIREDFASSTAIRNLICKGNFLEIRKVVPKTTYALIANEIKRGNIIPDISKYEKEIIYRLRTMSTTEIADLPDVSEGLENKIKEAVNSCNNIRALLKHLDSKRYTQSRIQRILLYALFGITKKQMADSKKILSPYTRVLGCSEHGKEMISDNCHKNPRIQIVTSVKKYMLNSSNKTLKEMLEQDIMATNIYTLGYTKTSFANLDNTNKIIVI